ncbi:hypothetical protein M440DRAFT_1070576 [Trichoderma longibrachiatum ATCC 18648]|uniref:Uncharacterized protein n=1 Tax=Trichoderma longibrachiatum ATCC 18648 TaxID=983965 RepID=A0A2T4BUP1_TRILO|nr:hypothetical protein M440DRAFT_1070576 [Trichoderma longibrachiatum ATCC 18648]
MDLSLFQQQHGRPVGVGVGRGAASMPPALTPTSNASVASPGSGSVPGNLRLPVIGGGNPGGLGGLDYRGMVSHDAEAALPEPHAGGPPKKKQKRNKPTLSCHECVERKTKVRAFPACASHWSWPAFDARQ